MIGVLLCASGAAACTGDRPCALLASAAKDLDTADWFERDGRAYSDVNFAATHNSYAGAHGRGDVGSIRAQLDRGVRMLELDIHDDDYENESFRVGHLLPGNEVFHGDDNPKTDQLDAWLQTIADWSNAHPRHAPITLLLDLKDALGKNESYAEGDLEALNTSLERVFGAKLFAASEVETKKWPTIAALRGRIIVVLSGSEASRLAYRGQEGHAPAVAMNDHGIVVEVHHDRAGDLHYWTGEYQDDGRIVWRRHGIYDTGLRPAIDINNNGLIVEVHEDPDHNDDQLWYRVGRVRPDFEIEWFSDEGLELPDADEGLRPSIRFVDRNTNELREIHRSPTTGLHWYWAGTFDPARNRVRWRRDETGSGRTREPRFLRQVATAGLRAVEVFTGSDGDFGGDTLLYSTDRVGPMRVRYRQLAFVELRHGSSPRLAGDDLLFYSGPAEELSARAWASTWRAAGKIARLWSFNDAALTTEASVNFPATDQPFSSWYDTYRRTLSTVR